MRPSGCEVVSFLLIWPCRYACVWTYLVKSATRCVCGDSFASHAHLLTFGHSCLMKPIVQDTNKPILQDRVRRSASIKWSSLIRTASVRVHECQSNWTQYQSKTKINTSCTFNWSVWLSSCTECQDIGRLSVEAGVSLNCNESTPQHWLQRPKTNKADMTSTSRKQLLFGRTKFNPAYFTN